ncbi:MAG: FGGY-family carbohydrate kinase [Granulosicoccus sp.]
MKEHKAHGSMRVSNALFIGVDIGTGGVRAVCTDSEMHVHASATVSFDQFDGKRADPHLWFKAVSQVLMDIINRVSVDAIQAIAVDGTSGTVTVTDADFQPLCDALMYDFSCPDNGILQSIAEHASRSSAAHGASSGLAKAILLSRGRKCSFIQHEADWIAGCLSGRVGLSDQNNALKTGYDPVSERWPDWIEHTGVDMSLLPTVLKVGEPIGQAKGPLARQAGLPEHVLVVSGTTDGCASFLATGASEPGDGVSALGSTLTIKLLSEKPVYAPEYGIYSHRMGDIWLAGGASNTGGKVLAHFFTEQELAELSLMIDPKRASGLDYYPLLKPGERFPVNDESLQPRLSPRPESDVLFLQGMLEGISGIEKLAYDRLYELGAPRLKSIRSVGGGSKNPVWMQIRKGQTGVVFPECLSVQAATGAALLARNGAVRAGLVTL